MKANNPGETDTGAYAQDQSESAWFGLFIGLDLRVHSVEGIAGMFNVHNMLHGIQMVGIDIQETDCHMVGWQIDRVHSLIIFSGGHLVFALDIDDQALGELR